MIDFSTAASVGSASSGAAQTLASMQSVVNSTIRDPNQNQQQQQSSSAILNFRQSSGQSSSANNANSLLHTFGNIGSGIGGTGSGGGPPPPTLDMNEFPSLGGSVSLNTFPQSSTIGRPAYVGMVKDNVPNQSGSNEFNIQSEDFPALPGASPGTTAAAVASFHFQNNTGSTSNQDGSASNNNNPNDHHHQHHQNDNSNRVATTPPNLGGGGGNTAAAMGAPNLTTSLFSSLSSNSATTNTTPSSATSSNGNNNGGNGLKKTIHVAKDGRVTNIPAGMLNDQYGIAGLLAMLQQADAHPNMFALTIGYDITNINMNLNSKERLYHTYPGPWNEKPLKPYEIDYPVPQEYLVYNTIRDKLSQIKLSNYTDDLLFFLFYCCAGENMQAAVGAELYNRDWRFHKDEGVWITRNKTAHLLEQTSNYERGSYIYFDTNTWSKVQKEMVIEYDRLVE